MFGHPAIRTIGSREANASIESHVRCYWVQRMDGGGRQIFVVHPGWGEAGTVVLRRLRCRKGATGVTLAAMD